MWNKDQRHHRKNRTSLTYPSLDSTIKPVPHSEELPIPVFEGLPQLESALFSEDDLSSTVSETTIADNDFPPSLLPPQLFSQNELNDSARDLNLSKESSELLASRLKEKNLLQPGTFITYYRNRHTEFLPYFTQEKDIVFCNNVEGVLKKLGVTQYDPNDWRLFIDSCKRSLKCVLLHNGNDFGSIPLGHSTTLKEKYSDIKFVLEKIGYYKHNWIICVDLKMVGFLLGLQGGYTKFSCFICLWDSRAREQHWRQKEWPVSEQMVPGEKNIQAQPLVERSKIIFPPLHIKLEVMKQFVKALNKEGAYFKYICGEFPGLTIEKLKAGIFNEPQIRKLMNDHEFPSSMSKEEFFAGDAFVKAVKNFFGNKKASTYKERLTNLLSSFEDIGAKMSIKVHFLHSHLDRFPKNLGALSDEQGERFHQDVKEMDERYQGRWDAVMLANYCWSIKRDSVSTHSRKSLKRKFMVGTS